MPAKSSRGVASRKSSLNVKADTTRNDKRSCGADMFYGLGTELDPLDGGVTVALRRREGDARQIRQRGHIMQRGPIMMDDDHAGLHLRHAPSCHGRQRPVHSLTRVG